MKKFFAIILLLVQTTLFAQIQEPVKWQFEQNRLDDSNIELSFTAQIEQGWHLYDITFSEDTPVLPTTFTFDNLKNVTLVGGVFADRKPQKSFDPNFEMELAYYSNLVTFKQKAKVSGQYSVSGNVRFMACNDQTCLAPSSVNFHFEDTSKSVKITADEQPKEQMQLEELPSEPMQTIEPSVLAEEATSLPSSWQPVEMAQLSEQQDQISATSYWRIFFDGLLAGLLALFTPCVWPIIPLTVSFFLKRKKGKRDSFLYGLSIVIIYTFVGMLVTYLFGAGRLNALSTSAGFNIFCFLLLVLFGASFLGMFEITLPSSWSTKLDARADKVGGLAGIFLMAATLSLVSFSCTGPIVGTLLVAESVDGAFLAPLVGMLGFSIALAVPFTIFALFPSWLSQLPKSGSWLNVVKVTLGFFELAFSLKFLSVADLAYGWHILDREVFLSVWIVLSALLGFYFLGKIRFAHEEEVKNISFARFALALVSLAFAVYMIPGLWGAPLKAISAFAPPMSTQDFNLNSKEKTVFNDYDEGMRYAQQHHKNVLLDFSGYGCVNCRKMEAAVLTAPEVRDLIDNNFVEITLFVDDRTLLDAPRQVEENGEELTLKTYGELWSYLQRYKFSANAQPYYVVLDENGDMLVAPYSFSEKVQDFVAFLKKGDKKQ